MCDGIGKGGVKVVCRASGISLCAEEIACVQPIQQIRVEIATKSRGFCDEVRSFYIFVEVEPVFMRPHSAILRAGFSEADHSVFLSIGVVEYQFSICAMLQRQQSRQRSTRQRQILQCSPQSRQIGIGVNTAVSFEKLIGFAAVDDILSGFQIEPTR